MEFRVERLEADAKDIKSDMKAVRSDLTDIKVTLARIEADLRHKVDYRWLAVTLAGIALFALREEIITLIRS